MTRRDTLLAGAFAVLAALRSLPFASRYAYHWDSAQFALAVEGEFNVAHGQPHAPGYFLYVLAGRLINAVVGDPHQSLVWLSVCAAAALTGLAYLLGTSLFDRRVGVITAALLLVSPLVWFHSAIALTTIVDAALVTGLALVAWTAARRGGTTGDVVALALLFAAIAGVRPQTAPTLLPLLGYTFWNMTGARGWKCAAGLAVATVACLVWFLPMASLSGGLESYRQALAAKADFDASKTPFGGGGLRAVWDNLSMIVESCWVGLLAAGALALGAVAALRLRGGARSGTPRRPAFVFLAVWAAPMVLFGTLSYMTMPGYVLGYFPALAIVTAWILAHGAPVALVVVACLVNGWVFVAEPNWSHRFLMGLPLTAPEIRRHDATLERAVTRLRATDATVLHAVESFQYGFRHFQYHLPERRQVQVMADPSLPGERGRQFWVGEQHWTEFIAPWSALPAGEFLLVVPPGMGVEIFAPLIDPGAAEQVDELLWHVRGAER